jgi:hypothetical protein
LPKPYNLLSCTVSALRGLVNIPRRKPNSHPKSPFHTCTSFEVDPDP